MMAANVLALGSSDAIGLAPLRTAWCCARIRRDGKTGWCHLPDGHVGDHDGALWAPPLADGFGPRSKRP